MVRRSTRSPKPPQRLNAALKAVAAALREFPHAAMIIGGIAIIARGVPRVTRDIDATIIAGKLTPKQILEKLLKHSLSPRIANAVEFAEQNQVLLLRHEASSVDVDVSLAWLPFEIQATRNSDAIKVGSVTVPIARAEDLVIYKAVAWRPQDQQDIERLLTLYKDRLDLERIRRIIGEFAGALETPERLLDFERMLARIPG